eukprot:Tbor_TRINITY_DN4340_c1_g1::TRINITY_DN4340_c1_g1_i1::g.7775::m.7775/K17278/PGRMC1_2; membrane-associated progesterone receptor component
MSIFKANDLKKKDGTNGEEIYLSLKGVVYDVTSGVDFYGPGKPYGVFAGKEVSRCLAKMDINDNESNADWENLNEEHTNTLNEWESKFQSKYPVVGQFLPDSQFKTRGFSFDP